MEPSAIRYVQAGADDAERLVTLLGLERFAAAGCTLSASEVVGDTLRVQLAWPGVGEGWLVLRPDDGTPAFCTTGRIALSFLGGAVTRPFAVLMRRVAAVLGPRTVEDLVEWLRLPAPFFAEEFQSSPINAWAGDASWRAFLCDHAMQRKFYESFTFDGPSSFIVHGDLECKFITPRTRSRIPRFFNYPWGLMGDTETGTPITDMQDLDVIGGSEQRLEEAIRDEIERMGDRGPVIVNSTCVPVMIGDDVDEVLGRHRHECAMGLYHISPRTTNPVEVFLQYLDRAKQRFRERGETEVPGSVALVGFRNEPARNELVDLLVDAGIPVNGCVLPVASEPMMEDALRSQVLVFRPSVFHADLYERVFGDCTAPRLDPVAPWGFALTEAWFRAVGESVGRADAALATLERRRAALAPRIARARSVAARGQALAFVVEPSQARRLVSPMSASGLPVATVALDLGFRVRVLLFAGERGPAVEARERLEAAAAGGALDVVEFTTPDDLQAALSDPAVGAVFTEYFFDTRLSRRGKGQFSAKDFEMGLDGAVRTLERLSRLIGTPFWNSYGGRLAGRWWT